MTELTHLPGSNKSSRPEEQGWMLIQQTLNPLFHGLKSEVSEYQIYGTNDQRMSKLQRHQYVPIPIWWLSMQKNCWCYLNLALQMSWFTVNCLAEILIMVLLGLLRITTEEEKEEEKKKTMKRNKKKKKNKKTNLTTKHIIVDSHLQFKMVFWLLKFFFLKIDLLVNVILSEDKGWNHIQGYPQRKKLYIE